MSNPANPQCQSYTTDPKIKASMDQDRQRAVYRQIIGGPTRDTLKPGETPVSPRKQGLTQALIRWIRKRAA